MKTGETFQFEVQRARFLRTKDYYVFIDYEHFVVAKAPNMRNPKLQIDINLNLKISWCFGTKNNRKYLEGFTLMDLGQKIIFKAKEPDLLRMKDMIQGRVIFGGINDFYDPQGVIGEGKNASILRCRENFTQNEYAVKVIKKPHQLQHKEIYLLLNEARVLNELNKEPHKAFYKLHDIYENEQYFFLVLDLLKGKTLAYLLEYNNIHNQGFEKDIVKIIMKQLLEGVEVLHSKGIIHRHLVPENLMFESSQDWNSLKIIDFSNAVCKKQNSSFVNCLSPELQEADNVQSTQLSKMFSELSDIVDCGYIFHYLLSGEKKGKQYQKKQQQQPDPDEDFEFHSLQNEGMEPIEIELLKLLLEMDVKKKVSATEILKHKYFKQAQEILSSTQLNKYRSLDLYDNDMDDCTNLEVRPFPSIKKMNFKYEGFKEPQQSFPVGASNMNMKSTLSIGPFQFSQMQSLLPEKIPTRQMEESQQKLLLPMRSNRTTI